MFIKKNVARMFAVCPTIHSLLLEAQNPMAARGFLDSYVENLLNAMNRDKSKIQPLEWTLQMSCISAFRKIISIRSERLAKFSTVKLLWRLARKEYDKLPIGLHNGFFEEMIHLFLGMQGKSGIYTGVKYPEFIRLEGREAAILRSGKLDEMASTGAKFIKKYSSGLDEKLIKTRAKNKLRILKYFKATEGDWNNYLWHIQHVIKESKHIRALIKLTKEEKEAIDLAKKAKLPFGLTPYYLSLMDKKPDRKRDHAVRAQVFPPLDYVKKMMARSNVYSSSCDFMMERETSPIELVTRRYPNIAILKPFNTCAQICVYCQRNWEIKDVLFPEALASKEKISLAIRWIRDHPALEDILVTGGDPLIMSDKNIEFVLSGLAQIEHIERIRIGSRTPVVLPQRITKSLMDIIAKYHEPGKREVVLVTHFEHPYEITPEAMEAVQKFKRRGMSVYNQTVFTIENSRKFELVALRKILRLIGVDPYYTFNTKGKEETKNYRAPLARLQQEIKEEARLTSGIVRTDEPVYNVPKLGKNYIRAQQHHSLLSILPNGRRVYEFHPWEKNLALADTYIDTDVSIYGYLMEMKKRGENIEDYKSIWYYY